MADRNIRGCSVSAATHHRMHLQLIFTDGLHLDYTARRWKLVWLWRLISLLMRFCCGQCACYWSVIGSFYHVLIGRRKNSCAWVWNWSGVWWCHCRNIRRAIICCKRSSLHRATLRSKIRHKNRRRSRVRQRNGMWQWIQMWINSGRSATACWVLWSSGGCHVIRPTGDDVRVRFQHII